MGQKKDSQKSSSTATAKATFLGAGAAVDPLLASLFESSVRYLLSGLPASRTWSLLKQTVDLIVPFRFDRPDR
jgi:hypothetical protein